MSETWFCHKCHAHFLQPAIDKNTCYICPNCKSISIEPFKESSEEVDAKKVIKTGESIRESAESRHLQIDHPEDALNEKEYQWHQRMEEMEEKHKHEMHDVMAQMEMQCHEQMKEMEGKYQVEIQHLQER